MTSYNRREFINTFGKYGLAGLGVSTLLPACIAYQEVVNTLESRGLITAGVSNGLTTLGQSYEDITPEQEYYIGRSISAVVLNTYRPYENEKANHYINVLGHTLSQASDKPETFNGYHFLIQDSDDINAFAAPGGFIFLTRGMVRCCNHEDAVAAVLSHEIGHIQHTHGLKAIKQSRLTSALTMLGTEAGKKYGDEDLKQLATDFEDSIQDISNTLITSGYSRSTEREADKAAVTILDRVGYNPNGLVEMLRTMEKKLKPGGLDFARTHPSPANRIQDIQNVIGNTGDVEKPAGRQDRFTAALGNV